MFFMVSMPLKVRGNSPKINPKNVKMVIGCNDHTGTA